MILNIRHMCFARVESEASWHCSICVFSLPHSGESSNLNVTADIRVFELSLLLYENVFCLSGQSLRYETGLLGRV